MSFETSPGFEDDLALPSFQEEALFISFVSKSEEASTPEGADYEALLLENSMRVELARASSKLPDAGEEVWPLLLAAADGSRILDEGERYEGPLDPRNRMVLYRMFDTASAELSRTNVRQLPDGEMVTTVPLNDRSAIVERLHNPAEGAENDTQWTSISVVTLKPEQHPEDGLAAVHEEI